MTKTPQRFAWAARALQLSPSHQVLELGCGAGLLVAEMLDYLKTGSVTAIDQSAAMISKAIKRNAEGVDDGRAIFQQVALADYKPKPKKKFDIITGFNFNVFIKFPQAEMEIIRNLLKPGGGLFVFYQAPYALSRSDSRPIVDGLLAAGFITGTVSLKNFDERNAMLVRASLPKN